MHAPADLLGMADREPLQRPLQPPVQRVLTHHPNRRRRSDHRCRTVVTVHQQHKRLDGVAADLHVLRKGREYPDPATALEAAGGLEVQLAPQQLIDEPERLLVLNDPVPLSNYPEDCPSVLADGRVLARDLPPAGPPPIIRRGGLTRSIAIGSRSTRQPSPEAWIASAIVAGERSRTAPKRSTGLGTENFDRCW